MPWMTAAFISTALFGVVTILDRKLLVRYFSSTASFNFAFAVTQIVLATILLLIVVPLLGVPSAAGMIWGIASGLSWAAGLSLFFFGLRMEEVSRATPVYLSFPIFASIIAVLFLGEELRPLQWVAIVVVVIGGGLVSARRIPGRKGLFRVRALIVLIIAALTTGVAFVVTKEATNATSIWVVHSFRAAGLAIGFVALSVRPSVWKQFRRDATPQAIGLFILTEGISAPLAALTVIVALMLGPVSLVSAVTATRPLLVLVMSAALSTRYWNVLNEPLDRSTLALKAVSTVLIVGGVTVLVVA